MVPGDYQVVPRLLMMVPNGALGDLVLLETIGKYQVVLYQHLITNTNCWLSTGSNSAMFLLPTPSSTVHYFRPSLLSANDQSMTFPLPLDR